MFLYDYRFIWKYVWLFEVVYINKGIVSYGKSEISRIKYSLFAALDKLFQIFAAQFTYLEKRIICRLKLGMQRRKHGNWSSVGSIHTSHFWNWCQSTINSTFMPTMEMFLVMSFIRLFIFLKTYLFRTRHWIHSCGYSSEQSGNDVFPFRTFRLIYR